MERSATMAPVVLLPGILMPATARYEPLLAELGEHTPAVTKELEVYAGDRPPEGYRIQTEVDGLDRFVQSRGFDRFHLYGHSGGAAVALAYAVQHPDRVLSLALDEPATDFSAEDRARIAADFPTPLGELPPAERMAAFAASLVRPGVEPPGPPPQPDGPEGAKRPAGVVAFEAALHTHELDAGGAARVTPVGYLSYGSLSSPRFEQMAARLAGRFPHWWIECYEGLHHLHTSHAAEPARVAARLHALWAQVPAPTG